MDTAFESICSFIRGLYPNDMPIILHRPRFGEAEKAYVLDTIDSTFVSTVGGYVNDFEQKFAMFTGARHAVAANSGTSALHIALVTAGVGPHDLVVTQPLTFVATCNAIRYTGADPLFVDVDRDTLGLSPEKLQSFLDAETETRGDGIFHKASGRRIAACVPMHTFGLPMRIKMVADICARSGIALVEDAAEALGSRAPDGRHMGTFGRASAFSFNGNKIITSGGGGMIITDDEEVARRAKHLTTTAKTDGLYFLHDEVGYNYRMPNLNAALGLAQLERLPDFLERKRIINDAYAAFFKDHDFSLVTGAEGLSSGRNNWLNALVLPNKGTRDAFLNYTNDKGIFTRPIWELMSNLPMFKNCIKGDLGNSAWLQDRVVNVPSSVPL